jgi:hypothetical protein
MKMMPLPRCVSVEGIVGAEAYHKGLVERWRG